jgi:hypothetical protein
MTGYIAVSIQHGILDTIRERIETWKDKYRGKRCFCIGNGPSLKHTPLHLLQNEYSFGLNKIADIYPTTSWRPTFYVNVTVMATDRKWAKAARLAMTGTPSFINYGVLPFVLGNTQDKELHVPENVFPIAVSKQYRQRNPPPSIWSHDIAGGVSKYGSSMLSVLQIAVYMGFSPIYLLGCDLGWKPFKWGAKDPNHFCEDYWGMPIIESGEKILVTQGKARRYTADALSSHVLAKKVCDPLGVKIYNATIGGDLEVYPRVDIMDVVNGTS